MNFSPGSKIGDYEILTPLGAGGMGRVYKVRNELSDRLEAMKVLLPDLESQTDLANRFLREIKTQANLDHPNIAKLYTASRVENRLLMFMEFVEGITLDERLKQGPVPIPIADAIDYIQQVLGALEYAHQRGVVHRDIKPANMMLMPDGRVKLLDFGIAKAAADNRLTMTGTTLGSLYYMAPEQIQGGAVDVRSDLYSVGVSLYEMVTGNKPFDGESQFAIMSAHLARNPVPPIEMNTSLPPAVSEIILMSLSKEPIDRFQTAGAFLNALRNVQLGGVSATRFAPAEPPVRANFGMQETAPLTMPPPPPPPAARAPFAATAPFKDSVANVAAAPATPPPPAGEFHLIEPTHAPAKKSGPKRMIWVALGGLAAALAIVAFIQLGPRMKTSAKETSMPDQRSVTPTSTQPSNLPPALSPGLSAPRNPPPANHSNTSLPPAPGKPGAAAEGRKSPQTDRAQVQPEGPNAAQQQPAAQPPQPQQQAPPPQATTPQRTTADAVLSNLANNGRMEIDALSEQYTMMIARAKAVQSSMEKLRASQASQGLGMRPDWNAADDLLVTYMQRAKQALAGGDAPAAKAALAKAEPQLEVLEKAMGR